MSIEFWYGSTPILWCRFLLWIAEYSFWRTVSEGCCSWKQGRGGRMRNPKDCYLRTDGGSCGWWRGTGYRGRWREILSFFWLTGSWRLDRCFGWGCTCSLVPVWYSSFCVCWRISWSVWFLFFPLFPDPSWEKSNIFQPGLLDLRSEIASLRINRSFYASFACILGLKRLKVPGVSSSAFILFYYNNIETAQPCTNPSFCANCSEMSMKENPSEPTLNIPFLSTIIANHSSLISPSPLLKDPLQSQKKILTSRIVQQTNYLERYRNRMARDIWITGWRSTSQTSCLSDERSQFLRTLPIGAQKHTKTQWPK